MPVMGERSIILYLLGPHVAYSESFAVRLLPLIVILREVGKQARHVGRGSIAPQDGRQVKLGGAAKKSRHCYGCYDLQA